MNAASKPRVSKSQADKAGKTIKRFVKDFGPTVKQDELDRALATASDFRSTFASPLAMVTIGTRVIVRRIAPTAVAQIGARPKTLKSIAMKLCKQSVRLSQIEDIAGCRVILPTAGELDAVRAAILQRWPGAEIDDYVANPKATGYRAVHIIVTEQGRKVEIQLRTPSQHRWADTVEEWADRLGINTLGWSLKDGQGPDDLVEYFKNAADRLAEDEQGITRDQEAERRFSELRREVTGYFRGHKKVEPPWET